MNRFILNSILSLSLTFSMISCAGMGDGDSGSGSTVQTSGAKGNLVIVGGGARPLSIMNKIVELSPDSTMIIIPMASSIPDTVGVEQGDQFLGYGAKSVEVMMLTETDKTSEEIAEKIRNAGGIWFSGGDQNRLMEYLGDGILIEAIHEAYRNGAVISGTSAGAAVMSRVMITGDESSPDEDRSFATIHQDNIVTTAGIGLVTNMIIDQHFVRRSRMNRLISALLDHPEEYAAGIDEATALWVKPNGEYEVLGESQVILMKDGISKDGAPGDLHAASGMEFHVLTPGSIFRIQTDNDLQVELGQ